MDLQGDLVEVLVAGREIQPSSSALAPSPTASLPKLILLSRLPKFSVTQSILPSRSTRAQSFAMWNVFAPHSWSVIIAEDRRRRHVQFLGHHGLDQRRVRRRHVVPRSSPWLRSPATTSRRGTHDRLRRFQIVANEYSAQKFDTRREYAQKYRRSRTRRSAPRICPRLTPRARFLNMVPHAVQDVSTAASSSGRTIIDPVFQNAGHIPDSEPAILDRHDHIKLPVPLVERECHSIQSTSRGLSGS